MSHALINITNMAHYCETCFYWSQSKTLISLKDYLRSNEMPTQKLIELHQKISATPRLT